jgi:hypothetical protein
MQVATFGFPASIDFRHNAPYDDLIVVEELGNDMVSSESAGHAQLDAQRLR